MLTTLICATAMTAATAMPVQTATDSYPKVAVLPWSMRAGTDGGMQAVKDTVNALFEKTRYEAISPVRVAGVWEQELSKPAVREKIDGDDGAPDLPSPKELLALGQKLGVDLVCAGRAKWHTKSVWVGLGPKTKADCTVDVIIVDVKKAEVALEARDVKADSTRREAGYETAAALLVSWGFTALSGGPKDPHHRRAGAVAVAKAFDPWLKTIVGGSRKIQ